MLGVGSGSHAEQIARVMERLEPVLADERPTWCSSPATSTRPWAPRSARRSWGSRSPTSSRGCGASTASMPEETNRIATDHLSALCFLHCDEAIENLRAEGVDDERMKFVGNTMIDTLVALEDRIRERGAARVARRRAGELPAGHAAPAGARRRAAARPRRWAALGGVARELPVVFPVHPRTRKMLDGRRVPGRDPHRPGRLPRLPLARGRRGGRAHRLGRDPGGDDLPRRPLLHAARQHRAAGHDPRRDQHAAGPRPGAHRARSRRCLRRARTQRAASEAPASYGTGMRPSRVADVVADW